ncbi:MAG: protein kinase [Proteobacteria bacterium]|jgi:serine/threonine-protein kinase|nr:protein kinase [Pseudomonadota bacterium]NLN62857.1 protein kinase [Myxococcales bacterium]
MKDRLLGRVIADRYRLESRLGVGGMGAVYRARHLLIDRAVAIKILQPERRGEEHFRAWFLREARAANRINHANIVDITDFGETEDGLAYLVMELLVGESLSTLIARGPMPLDVTLDIMEQTTAALARAHDLGVVHRDLKPDNIYLINRAGRKNYVKVIDFGLARLSQDGRLAAKGAVFGTPEYMSPEQARGEDATPASDLYSIGVIMFEMLTGRLPFNAKDRDGFIESHKHAKPPRADMFNKDLDPNIVEIIATLLSKPPEERFRDSHHFLEVLKTLQRRVAPVSPWDIRQQSATPPPQSAQPLASMIASTLNEVAAWALRATIFGRMVSTAYSGGAGPAPVMEAIESLWRLTAASARLDGELQADAKRNEELLRRGRDFSAQVGRRIEDLSREQSRIKREVATAKVDLERLSADYHRADKELQNARKIIATIDKNRDEMTEELRQAYERAGATAARRQARSEAVSKVQAKITKWKEDIARIETQVVEYRSQLERHSSAIDDDLGSSRKRLDAKVQEREAYNHRLEQAAQFLSEHFRGRPECLALFKELEELDRTSVVIEPR